MGAVGGLLGLGGGAGGTGFAGPQAAQGTLATTNPGQIGATYAGNQTAIGNQAALLSAIQQQNGLGNQSQVYGQLQGVANGTGPNPAQAMLNQSTGENVANQAALMAGQRGAAANVGLMARQAAQQGANTQQQAAGQAATLQAQQSLNALGQAGNIANTQAANQIGATQQNTQAQQQEQQIIQNAAANQNQQQIAMQSNINNANAGLAGQGMQNQAGFIGGLGNAAGSALKLGSSLFADGGAVPGAPPMPNGASSMMGQYLGATPMAAGGNVGSTLQSGGHVPGQASVSGNSYSNDTVKALLSPGELVVDRETMKSTGKAGEAARFLAAVIAAKKKGKK